MTTAIVSLGSNLGDSPALLRAAVADLGTAVRRVSSVYRTPPWGPVPQDDFLNVAVLVADDAVTAAGWLERCHDLERAANRQREVRWGPRTLDADVIAVWRRAEPGSVDSAAAKASAYDEALGADVIPVLSADPVLTLPHPRAFERGFVLVPWHEIEPDAVLPGHGPIAALLDAVDTSGINRVASLGGPGS